MDEKRRQEIALAILRYKLRAEGISPRHLDKRSLGNIAKGTGISLEEIEEFARDIIEEYLVEKFPRK